MAQSHLQTVIAMKHDNTIQKNDMAIIDGMVVFSGFPTQDGNYAISIVDPVAQLMRPTMQKNPQSQLANVIPDVANLSSGKYNQGPTISVKTKYTFKVYDGTATYAPTDIEKVMNGRALAPNQHVKVIVRVGESATGKDKTGAKELCLYLAGIIFDSFDNLQFTTGGNSIFSNDDLGIQGATSTREFVPTGAPQSSQTPYSNPQENVQNTNPYGNSQGAQLQGANGYGNPQGAQGNSVPYGTNPYAQNNQQSGQQNNVQGGQQSQYAQPPYAQPNNNAGNQNPYGSAPQGDAFANGETYDSTSDLF